MKDGEQALVFIGSIVDGMSRRSNQIVDHHDLGEVESPQKRLYGEAWTFIFGIGNGINEMYKGQETRYDAELEEFVDEGVSDYHWQKHYDEYGYGAYGRGLEIGKQLAFYSDDKFEFVEPEQDDEKNFTFIQ